MDKDFARVHVIETVRLTLEPLAATHAEAMFAVLREPEIYRYLDDAPPSCVAQLRSRYARLAAGRSPDGSQLWLNWVVRRSGAPPIGYVQATVISARTAWVAYVFSCQFGGQGYATEAVTAMLTELASRYGVERYLASVEAENGRSIRLLERLGFRGAAESESAGLDLSPTERLFIREWIAVAGQIKYLLPPEIPAPLEIPAVAAVYDRREGSYTSHSVGVNRPPPLIQVPPCRGDK